MRKHFALPLCLALALALSACEPTIEDRLAAAEESASQALDSLLAASQPSQDEPACPATRDAYAGRPSAARGG
ncbi:hypothetical protein [Pseudomonas sp. ENNP23]|uniref:hypothetical protein n=1 Tax=Pseudomonas sp. ENNP23 TaxID=1535636 RepID=UPI00084A7824|nr:hypothetical protein [Pseudomonas sp. ENNP23]OEC59282.1 hypothetical protein A9G05_12150 [Pseudomonas sp. ENNP23]